MKEDNCLHAALICLGMLCYSFAISTEKLNRSQLSLHGHHEKGKEGQVLHRSKRGWVWNQFFVIEEYTGPDPVLVGRVRNQPWSLSSSKHFFTFLLLETRGLFLKGDVLMHPLKTAEWFICD